MERDYCSIVKLEQLVFTMPRKIIYMNKILISKLKILIIRIV